MTAIAVDMILPVPPLLSRYLITEDVRKHYCPFSGMVLPFYVAPDGDMWGAGFGEHGGVGVIAYGKTVPEALRALASDLEQGISYSTPFPSHPAPQGEILESVDMAEPLFEEMEAQS